MSNHSLTLSMCLQISREYISNIVFQEPIEFDLVLVSGLFFTRHITPTAETTEVRLL